MFIRFVACVGVAVSSTSALAALSLVGSAGAGWQAFPGALNNYADPFRPYWDQRSLDGGNRNVGNYLNGSYTLPLPGGAAGSPNITPPWWGRTSNTNYNATMDNSVHFNRANPTTGVGTTLRLEVAGNSGINEIGWYDINDAAGSEVLHSVYSGGDSPVTSVTFSTSANFGLFLKSGNLIFFSESIRNRGGVMTVADRGVQHFAFFGADLTANAEKYFVGVEDLPLSGAGVEEVGDYNDLVFTLEAVPTPGTTSLIAIGAVFAMRRRR